MRPLKPAEIRGNWATLLLSWNTDDTLDLARVTEEIDILIGFGVDGIYANGTAGEFHTLTENEFDGVAALLSERCQRAGMPFSDRCQPYERADFAGAFAAQCGACAGRIPGHSSRLVSRE